jgi:tetratricopeptide (TPR) repeat protein
MTHNNLGAALADLSADDPAENLQKAISHFELTLKVYNQLEYPFEWARTQLNLAAAYATLPSGLLEGNFKKSINCYESALRVYTMQEHPREWAATQNNIGLAYWHLPSGNRAENLRKGVDSYGMALSVITREDFPETYALICSNSALACEALAEIEKDGKLINKATFLFEESAKAFADCGLAEDAKNSLKRIEDLRGFWERNKPKI